MSARDYEFYKAKYEKIKPIRGRSEDVRPIGERRRDWEQIVRVGDNYAARLYNTNVVEYLPNGDVILRTNGWHTPSTAEFIHEHSPFSCWKQNGKLWVRCLDKDGRALAYPLGNELHMKHTGDRRYEPAAPVVIQKKVVDRAKAKDARAPLQPFLAWAKTFLTLSDGWVMHETCKQGLGWKTEPMLGYATATYDARTIYNMLVEPIDGYDPEEIYLKVLCAMARAHVGHVATRLVESHPLYSDGRHISQFMRRFEDVQIDYERLRDVLYRWVRKFENVDKIVEVEPTNKAARRAV